MIADLTVDQLLAKLRAPAPSPSGGSAAAVAAAMAASLVTLVARASHDWPEARGVAAQASALADRLAALAEADAVAYAAALAEIRDIDASAPTRDHRIGVALSGAADAPLAIAEAAADVVALATLAATNGRPDVQPDAVVARELAAAATRGAARLVDANLLTRQGDDRSGRAAAAAAAVDAR